MALWMDLPEDMVVEILLRLPAKSLLRFKCVCRKWLVLIESPSFIDLHLRVRHNNGDQGILLFHEYIKGEEGKSFLSFHSDSDDELLSGVNVAPHLELDSVEDDGRIHKPFLVGSCNGIVCLSLEFGKFILFNPVLRGCGYKKISITTPLAFGCLPNPEFEYSDVDYGFGYDSLNDDYKILSTVNIMHYRGYPFIVGNNVEIYNLSTDSWRKLELDDGFSRFSADPPMLFFNGNLHWINLEDDDRDWNYYYIACFNLGTEVLRKIPIPDIELPINGFLVLLDEYLTFIQRYSRDGDSPNPSDIIYFDIWIMKGYGINETWIKRYHLEPLWNVDRPLLFLKNDRLICKDYPSPFDPPGDLFDEYKRHLVSIDLNTLQTQQYHHINVIRAISYRETLVSIINKKSSPPNPLLL